MFQFLPKQSQVGLRLPQHRAADGVSLPGTQRHQGRPASAVAQNRVRFAMAGSFLVLLLGCTVSESAPALPRVSIHRDGRSFVTAAGEPYVPMGVNYFRPGTGWAPQVWKQFDPEATRQDFLKMKQLGVNCVRVFLTFGSFCPEKGQLNAEALAKFDTLLQIAEETGIYLHPTGPDHWEGVPDWAKNDRISDEGFLEGLEAFWKQFARRYVGRTALFAYDLRNEPQVPWQSSSLAPKWKAWIIRHRGSVENAMKHWDLAAGTAMADLIPEGKDAPGQKWLLDYQHFREEIADHWTQRQVTAIKAADPKALVTVGLIQWSVPSLLPGVKQYAAFKPARQAQFLDFMEVHFYPLNQGALEYRSAEEINRNLAYAESVVREVARTAKPVVVAEFGWYGGGKPRFGQGRHPAATQENQAEWCRRLVETTKGLATGWLNWGLYDHPQAGDVTELTGLLTADGKVKAWGREFKTLADKLTGGVIPSASLGARPNLDWDLCITSTAEGNRFRNEYYREFIR